MHWLMISTLLFVVLLGLAYWFIVNPVSVNFEQDLSKGTQQDHLKEHVFFLTQVYPARSYENTASLDQCADYIFNHFSSLELDPSRQPYSDDQYSFQNVLASYLPEKKQRVVVGAHYDVCGPFMGADDNASGVAGLLELARLFSENQPALDYGIDFVAYSTEEPPYFRGPLMGSYVHAESIAPQKANVKLMVVLEMIGYFNESAGSQKYPIGFLNAIYPTRANFIALVGRTQEFWSVRKFKKSFLSASRLPMKSINAPVSFDGLDRSDHRNYWIFGMKAIMVTNTSFYRNHHYHTDGDTPETLDFEKMREVVQGCYYALKNL